ncbi:hypothetical protein PtB15_14B347 [Puccinia triticina]|nr:hypothetical protein PtB15_14B347 [Puccinia triticina]
MVSNSGHAYVDGHGGRGIQYQDGLCTQLPYWKALKGHSGGFTLLVSDLAPG